MNIILHHWHHRTYACCSTAEAVKIVRTLHLRRLTPAKPTTIQSSKPKVHFRGFSAPARMSAAVAFQSPKYIQQAGALQRVGEFAKESFKDARKASILTSARLRSRYMEAMCQSVANPVIAEFSGECSRSNLRSILGKMQGQQVDYIIGFGGGKLLDMAKLVGFAACFLQRKLPAEQRQGKHTVATHMSTVANNPCSKASISSEGKQTVTTCCVATCDCVRSCTSAPKPGGTRDAAASGGRPLPIIHRRPLHSPERGVQ